MTPAESFGSELILFDMKQLNYILCIISKLEATEDTPTLHATRWGHNLPKPSGGEIFRSIVTTSRCLMRPLLRRNKHICYDWYESLKMRFDVREVSA